MHVCAEWDWEQLGPRFCPAEHALLRVGTHCVHPFDCVYDAGTSRGGRCFAALLCGVDDHFLRCVFCDLLTVQMA